MQIAVLADITWQGKPVKPMLWANRNGNFYVLDRTNGKFLSGKPFVKVNWMSGFDANGRPMQTPQPAGQPTWPGNQGGTNWYSPSFSPRTGLFYVTTWENYATIYRRESPGVRARARISAAAADVNAAGAGRARCAHRQNHADQQLDGRGPATAR